MITSLDLIHPPLGVHEIALLSLSIILIWTVPAPHGLISFSIGSNDLTQLTLGLDRDSELIQHIYDERNEAVKIMIRNAIKTCKKNGVKNWGPHFWPYPPFFLPGWSSGPPIVTFCYFIELNSSQGFQ